MSLSVLETRNKVALLARYLDPILVGDLICLFKQCFKALEPGQEYIFKIGRCVDKDLDRYAILDSDGDPFRMQLEGVVSYADDVTFVGNGNYCHTITMNRESRNLWNRILSHMDTFTATNKLILNYNTLLYKGNYRLTVKLTEVKIYIQDLISQLCINIIDHERMPYECDDD